MRVSGGVERWRRQVVLMAGERNNGGDIKWRGAGGKLLRAGGESDVSGGGGMGGGGGGGDQGRWR